MASETYDLLNFINTLYEGDLHAKRMLSLTNATLGVLTSASLAIHAVGRGLAQAMGTVCCCSARWRLPYCRCWARRAGGRADRV